MRIVIQRCEFGRVKVNGQTVGEIQKGIVALVGIIETDNQKTIDYMIDKVVNLRIFEDENEKMNLSLKDVDGQLLLIPNFTLYGDVRKGKRPSFSTAAKPEDAEKIFENLLISAKNIDTPKPIKVESGVFRAEMKVEILNDGPVTILLDSDKLF